MKPSNLGKENVTEVLMNLPAKKKGYTFLFVEGRDDRCFWNRYCVNKCDVYAAGDQEKVIETLRKKHLRKNLRQRVAGIVDPDYELIDPTGKLLVEDLLHDDVPDLENMVVSQKTIANAIQTPGPFRNQIDADKFAKEWLTVAVRLSMDYGYFRLVSRKNIKLNLVPNSIQGCYREYVDYSKLRLNFSKSAELLVKRSLTARISAVDLLKEVGVVERRIGSSPLLVRGKDLLNFMLCVCMTVFEKADIDPSSRARLQDWLKVVRDSEELFKRLQFKYNDEDLKKTSLYTGIRTWEAANKRQYKILKPEI